MMIYVIGGNSAPYIRALKKRNLPCTVAAASDFPSLTVLAEIKKLSGVVLLESAWSVQHVAAAAKAMTGKIVVLPKNLMPELPDRLCKRISSPDEISALFTESSPQPHKVHQQSKNPTVKEPVLTKPLILDKLPPGVTLRVAVAGSQSRIGCTCQAFSLWQYCKALGFTPLIVMADANKKAELAAAVGQDRLPGITVVEQIPVSTSEMPGFNCYVYDLGVLTAQNAAILETVDAGALVIGVKPWELRHAVQALRFIPAHTAVLLYQSTLEEAAPLKNILAGHAVDTATLSDNIYLPYSVALAVWERLLWPTLTQKLGQYRSNNFS